MSARAGRDAQADLRISGNPSSLVIPGRETPAMPFSDWIHSRPDRKVVRWARADRAATNAMSKRRPGPPMPRRLSHVSIRRIGPEGSLTVKESYSE